MFRNVAPGTVHVWMAGLEAEHDLVSPMLALLGGDERARAARFGSTDARLRFIVSRGALRTILAPYAGVPPEALAFERTPDGKPSVRGSGLAFSYASSEGLAMCAITVEGRVGADLERVRRTPDADALVSRYFAPGEAQQYASWPEAEHPAAFFSGWTRKEAVVKALGSADARPLATFEVDLSPSATAPAIRFLTPPSAGEEHFHLRAFRPRSDYVAAVALDREIDAFEILEWAPEAAASPSRPSEPRGGFFRSFFSSRRRG